MDNTNTNDNITIGTLIEAKFGRNTVRGEIFEILSDTTFRAKNLRTGKDFVTSKGRITVIEAPAEEAEENISEPIELPADTIFITDNEAPAEAPAEEEAEEESEEVAEKPDTAPEEPQAEEAPAEAKEAQETAPEAPTAEAPAAPAAVEEKPRKMSLYAIALETLETEQVPMSTGEILATAEKLGLYHAEDWGKTPAQTLYSAFLREIKVKQEPRIIKGEARGKWELNANLKK